MKRLKFGQRGFYQHLEAFATDKAANPEVVATVRGILSEVRERGDAAVLEYTKKFDGFSCSASELRIDPVNLKQAERSLSPFERKQIRAAIAAVKFFHKQGLPRNWRKRNPHGAWVGERWYPIERVGIYIPAGNVPLVSTAVMTITLARLAGVPSIAVFSPAGRAGEISPQMLAGLSLCGATEVYRLGGAQAIGAMAYGTATIPAVNKIMGPGNAYVAEAQRQVFGDVGVDLLPGPSEALLIADASADVAYMAADLLAQAEHGSGRERVYGVFTEPTHIKLVEREIARQVKSLRHRAAIEKILAERTCFIEVPDLVAAAQVANFVAPEHLELHVEAFAYSELLRSIHTAGAVLCGHHTPTVLGDFVAGPSHTLPTARTGRFFSGLKITDFMRRSSVVEYDRRSLERARAAVAVFAMLEGLDAHGQSMEIRFGEAGK